MKHIIACTAVLLSLSLLLTPAHSAGDGVLVAEKKSNAPEDTQSIPEEAAPIQSPPSPDSDLQDNVLEVGRSMGWALAYENRKEGLFVWRFRSQCGSPEPPRNKCEGVFAWYIKRIGNDQIALDDPVAFSPECMDVNRRIAPACLRDEAIRHQEEFKRRWLNLAGPVRLTGPTAATHSAALEGEVLSRLIKELSYQ